MTPDDGQPSSPWVCLSAFTAAFVGLLLLVRCGGAFLAGHGRAAWRWLRRKCR